MRFKANPHPFSLLLAIRSGQDVVKLPVKVRHLYKCLLAALFLAGCTTVSQSSDLLQLSHLDETIVDLAGPATEAIYDPIALLQQGEAYRLKGEEVSASEAYKRFLELYPSHRMAPFAQYALGLSYMNQVRTSDRDPTPIENARMAFETLLTRYSETPYTDDAARRITTLATWQAEYQFGIGRYYYKQKAYPAAIARFEEGLRMGAYGPVTEKTLYYLGRAYVESGDPEKGEQILRGIRTR